MSSSLSVYSVVLKCLFCSKLLFGTSENQQAIQQHMLNSHGQTAEFIVKVKKKWKCSLCHKTFKNEIKWKWHEQEHLGKPQFGSLHEEIEWTGSKAHRIVKCTKLDKNGRKKTNRFGLNVKSERIRLAECEEGESDMCWFGQDDKCYSCSKTRSELYNEDNINHQFWMCQICYSGFCAKLKWRQHLNTTHILTPGRILYLQMLAKKNGSFITIHSKVSSSQKYTKRMLYNYNSRSIYT